MFDSSVPICPTFLSISDKNQKKTKLEIDFDHLWSSLILVSKVSISKNPSKIPAPGPPHGVSIPAMICVGVPQSVPSNLAVELFTSHGAPGEMLWWEKILWDVWIIWINNFWGIHFNGINVDWIWLDEFEKDWDHLGTIWDNDVIWCPKPMLKNIGCMPILSPHGKESVQSKCGVPKDHVDYPYKRGMVETLGPLNTWAHGNRTHCCGNKHQNVANLTNVSSELPTLQNLSRNGLEELVPWFLSTIWGANINLRCGCVGNLDAGPESTGKNLRKSPRPPSIMPSN